MHGVDRQLEDCGGGIVKCRRAPKRKHSMLPPPLDTTVIRRAGGVGGSPADGSGGSGGSGDGVSQSGQSAYLNLTADNTADALSSATMRFYADKLDGKF